MDDDWDDDDFEVVYEDSALLPPDASYGHVCDGGCQPDIEDSHDFRIIDLVGITLQTLGNVIEAAGAELGIGLRILSHEFHCASAHRRLKKHHRESRQIMIDYLKTTEEGPT